MVCVIIPGKVQKKLYINNFKINYYYLQNLAYLIHLCKGDH